MFSQVHIHELCLIGDEARIEKNFGQVKMDANFNTIEEEDDDFVYNKLV